MKRTSGEKQYSDLDSGRREKVSFYFLNHLLQARLSLHLESGQHELDEWINVYLAGLLSAVACSDRLFRAKPYLSPYDDDIQSYLGEHPGRATEYVVYRDNAEFGLVSVGVFKEIHRRGSYRHLLAQKPGDAGKVALYYRMAAGALEHIAGTGHVLVLTFHSLADHMDEAVCLLKTVAAEEWDFGEKLSDGSFFHLERELAEKGREEEYARMVDRFLEQFKGYRTDPTPENRLALCKLAGECERLNPAFSFDESLLD